jgi:hypothetical protein
MMLGPVGVKKEIQNAGALHVPAGEVYASEAEPDSLARWGRSQRQDPRMESFDAKVFSPEDANIDWTCRTRGAMPSVRSARSPRRPSTRAGRTTAALG